MTALDPKKGEITLIGTGGGYGESCIIHLGNNNWIVIDSCINPYNRQSLALDYLENVGVNLATDVKLIIATHWHDDHIQGLASLLNRCLSAEFCFSRILDQERFNLFFNLESRKNTLSKYSNSSTREFSECLKILEERRNRITGAYPDRLVFKVEIDDEACEVYTVSPSDESIIEFDKQIAELMHLAGSSDIQIVPKNPNHSSVVTLIRFGSHIALLGADLEVTNKVDTGWAGVVNKSKTISAPTSYFKISHHGSVTGYYEPLWQKFFLNDTVLTLTPYSKSNLPRNEMINIFHSKSSNLYTTSLNHTPKPKNRDKSIKKMIESLKLDIVEVKYLPGTITASISILDPNDKWEVVCNNNAAKV